MILCLDVGNSQIYGGVYSQDDIRLRFRRSLKLGASSDEIGLFLRAVLRENHLDPAAISKIAICSVVPDLTHSLVNCCKKYFACEPFLLQAGAKTGLQIKYRNPLEVGADRIANAIAACQLYPDRNVIVADFGTATTFCAISSQKNYLGGVIVAGLRIAMEALEMKTAKLPKVEIVQPKSVLGRSTVESIQIGLYYSHLATIQRVTADLATECFGNDRPVLLGTGGFARLFTNEDIFDAIDPDLVLKGLFFALKMNSLEEL